MSKRSQPLYVASEEQRRRLFAFSEKTLIFDNLVHNLIVGKGAF